MKVKEILQMDQSYPWNTFFWTYVSIIKKLLLINLFLIYTYITTYCL